MGGCAPEGGFTTDWSLHCTARRNSPFNGFRVIDRRILWHLSFRGSSIIFSSGLGLYARGWRRDVIVVIVFRLCIALKKMDQQLEGFVVREEAGEIAAWNWEPLALIVNIVEGKLAPQFTQPDTDTATARP